MVIYIFDFVVRSLSFLQTTAIYLHRVIRHVKQCSGQGWGAGYGAGAMDPTFSLEPEPELKPFLKRL